MRRKDREITDENEIDEIIMNSSCCRLGLNDNGKAYIVPMNFGFEHDDGKRIFYFHSATEGRKIDLIKQNDFASFELDTAFQLHEADEACGYTAAFQSVMGEGEVKFLTDENEKKSALSLIMKHYTGKDEWSFDERLLKITAVIKLTVSEISCKKHK